MATDRGPEEIPFWQRKSLAEMTDSEWESLCDGCGRCCLNKLEEEGTDRTFYTDVGCRLLDGQSLPLPRLRAPAGEGRRLRAAHAGEPENHHLAAAVLRLRAARRRARTSIGGIRLFPATRRPCMPPASRCAVACPGERDACARRRPRRPHRQLAAEAAKGGAAAEAAGVGGRFSTGTGCRAGLLCTEHGCAVI